MKIYLDTEFTGFHHPKLTSIALVSEDGQEFYRELLDGWKVPDCSHFILAWILPLLSDGRTGKRLHSKLQSHLDLLQFECDYDNLFPISKEDFLYQALQGDTELLEHHRWLLGKKDLANSKITRNPYITSRISGLCPRKLLTGEQAKSEEKVRHDLTEWLTRFQKVQICCDYDLDYMLVKKLLGIPLDWQLIEISEIRNPSLRLHHALDDARALQTQYLP